MRQRPKVARQTKNSCRSIQKCTSDQETKHAWKSPKVPQNSPKAECESCLGCVLLSRPPQILHKYGIINFGKVVQSVFCCLGRSVRTFLASPGSLLRFRNLPRKDAIMGADYGESDVAFHADRVGCPSSIADGGCQGSRKDLVCATWGQSFHRDQTTGRSAVFQVYHIPHSNVWSCSDRFSVGNTMEKEALGDCWRLLAFSFRPIWQVSMLLEFVRLW